MYLFKLDNLDPKYEKIISLFLYSFLNLLSFFISFIINIVVVNKLSVSLFGVYTNYLIFLGFLINFGYSWHSSVILYFGAKEKANTGKLTNTFWIRNLIFALSFFFTTFILFLFTIFGNFSFPINDIVILFYIFILSFFEDYLIQYFLAIDKKLKSSLLLLSTKLILFISVIFFEFDLFSLLVINLVSFSPLLIFIFFIKKDDFFPTKFDRLMFQKVLDFSIWQFIGFLGLFLINYGDLFLLSLLFTNESLAIYAVALKLFSALHSFSFIITNFYTTRLIKFYESMKIRNLRIFFYRDRLILFIISTFMHLLIIFFSNDIVNLLFGSRYTSASLILQVLMVGSIFNYWKVYYMLYLNIFGFHKYQQILNLFQAIFAVFLSYIFSSYYGILGIAAGSVISIIVISLIFLFLYEKKIYCLKKFNVK